MTKHIGWLVVAAMASLWGTAAWACGSNVNVSFSPSSPTVPNWNPFPSGTAQSVVLSVTVNKTSGGGNISRARLIIKDNQTTLPLRMETLNTFVGPIYTLVPGGAVSTMTRDNLTNANSLTFELPSGNGSVVAYATLTIPANAAEADFTSGTYSQSTTYLIQCYNQGNQEQGAAQTGPGPTLGVTVTNLLQVTTAGPQTIDFGNFTSTMQNLAIALRSTGAINANISTQRGNAMVLTTAQLPYPTNSTIPYSMSFDGHTVPSGGISLTNLARAGVGGGNKPLILTLPAQPAGKLAGTYEDLITIVLSPSS